LIAIKVTLLVKNSPWQRINKNKFLFSRVVWAFIRLETDQI